jgi:hypothetical protein
LLHGAGDLTTATAVVASTPPSAMQSSCTATCTIGAGAITTATTNPIFARGTPQETVLTSRDACRSASTLLTL